MKRNRSERLPVEKIIRKFEEQEAKPGPPEKRLQD
jgi:hypothetical protein